MPASIRVIKIVVDPVTQQEAYTVEFEVEAEESKDLLTELTASPYGQRLIQLLNQAQFLPDMPSKTTEELKAEAEKEDEERTKHEEELKEHGRDEGREEMRKFLEKTLDEEEYKKLEAKWNEKKEEEKQAKKEKIVLIDETRESE